MYAELNNLAYGLPANNYVIVASNTINSDATLTTSSTTPAKLQADELFNFPDDFATVLKGNSRDYAYARMRPAHWKDVHQRMETQHEADSNEM